MVDNLIDLKSRRAYEARLSRQIGKKGYQAIIALGLILLALAVAVAISRGLRYGFIVASLSVVCLVLSVWWKRYLSVLPVKGSGLTERLSVDVLSKLNPNEPLTASGLWKAISLDWQSAFILNHLLINEQLIKTELDKAEASLLTQALQIASQIADNNLSKQIEVGFVVAGLMLASPSIRQLMIQFRYQPKDIEAVANWLGRNLVEYNNIDKQNFGGIGRDWAFGFTPLLNRLGINVSLSIMKHNSHFGGLIESDAVKAMEAAFNNKNQAIALIGPFGIGKTNSVYAFAQRLIEGKTNKNLAYHQVIAISATDVVANSSRPGELEHIMISLANEAAHAGHIILFLDDAEAFFSDGPGSFDGSQIVSSIVGSGSFPIIIALTPNGYERLRASSPNLANLISPIIIKEPDEKAVMHVLEDISISLENKNKALITYEALAESYKLSGRYEQDEAYPGKAIKLLEQALACSPDKLVVRDSVYQAVEQTYGVKTGTAAPLEANELLNLESKIHERMINQSHAVKVVADSLRRARAGVTNPNRPLGSFLFLGPTGVGKTELAKSLAATYFGDESNMIRLDMSEYQQENDVSRLLSDGKNEAKSLIMSIRRQPFSVVLLDEIEKANPAILNLMLQLLDEGQLTDTNGRTASFKDSIIIATSNAGAQSIRSHVDSGKPLESFQPQLVEQLISSGQFKPELINRFDEIVLFRPLKPDELAQIVKLMVREVNSTLASQNISVSLSEEAISKIVAVGYDPKLGARPMRRTVQKAVEDTVAQKILSRKANPGDHISLDASDINL